MPTKPYSAPYALSELDRSLLARQAPHLFGDKPASFLEAYFYERDRNPDLRRTERKIKALIAQSNI